MKRFFTFFLLLGLASIWVPSPARADPEITIGYQGVVEANGEVLDDVTGEFKFAICDLDCAVTYWSNDGTSVAGSEPFDSVLVDIFNGIFNVLLGDATLENMEAITAQLFQDTGDEALYLRVWFDDGTHGLEQLTPDQRLALVPLAVKSVSIGEMLTTGSLNAAGNFTVTTTAAGSLNGVVLNAASVTDGVEVLIQSGDLGTNGLVLKVEDTNVSRTLFSVNEDGSASSRDIFLSALTNASDLARTGAGRIYYDGSSNVFKGCTNTACSEFALAGPTGVSDITSVIAGTGLSGGGTSGDVTLTVDTAVVVTKTGNHTMAGSLTATAASAATVTATTLNTTDLTASGTVTLASFTATGTATTANISISPTGTGAGNTAELQFRELSANGSNYVGFKAPDSILLNKTWVFPTGDGTGGQILTTNGTGTLSWATDDNSGGDISSVTAGTGIGGGGISGAISFNIVGASGIQTNNDGIQFEYDYDLAGTLLLQAGRAGFDSVDAQGGILFEGATSDVNELLLTVADPTVTDKTITIPNETATLCTSGTVCAGHQASATALTTSTSWGGDLTGTGTTPAVADNSVDGTDIALGSDAQGDVTYYNGTDWARLGAGASGYLLKTNGGSANPAWAGQTNYAAYDGNSNDATVAAGSTVYGPATGSLTMNGADAAGGTRTLVSRAATVTNLFVKASGGNGAGKTNSYFVMKNGVATSLTCNVTNDGAACSDASNNFAVAAGDEIGVRLTTDVGSNAVKHSWSMELQF